jgi:integrase
MRHGIRTIKAYGKHVADFTEWCVQKDRRLTSGDPMDVVADHLAGSGLSFPYMRQRLAAIRLHFKGHGMRFNREHPRILAALKKALAQHKPKGKSMVTEQHIEEWLRTPLAGKNIAARDLAIILLGWSARLRRADIATLDWQEAGGGGGVLVLNDDGLEVRVGGEPMFIVTRFWEPLLKALREWATRSGLRRGDAVFRAVNNRDEIAPERLSAHSITRIIKRRLGNVASGESLRNWPCPYCGLKGTNRNRKK